MIDHGHELPSARFAGQCLESEVIVTTLPASTSKRVWETPVRWRLTLRPKDYIHTPACSLKLIKPMPTFS